MTRINGITTNSNLNLNYIPQTEESAETFNLDANAGLSIEPNNEAVKLIEADLVAQYQDDTFTLQATPRIEMLLFKRDLNIQGQFDLSIDEEGVAPNASASVDYNIINRTFNAGNIQASYQGVYDLNSNTFSNSLFGELNYNSFSLDTEANLDLVFGSDDPLTYSAKATAGYTLSEEHNLKAFGTFGVSGSAMTGIQETSANFGISADF